MKIGNFRISKYFYLVAGAVLLIVLVIIVADSFRSRKVKDSFTTHMDNLRDLIFMSAYDSLKKGNMKTFKSHLEEIGTFNDVREFSLLTPQGEIRYSSNPQLIKEIDTEVLGLSHQREVNLDDYTIYYFPVETISYCSRCHTDWKLGEINSYYKLALSRKALDAVEESTLYYHGFTVLGGGVLIAFFFTLFTLYEKKKHEEKLQLSASVFESALEAIAITTYDGTVEKINPAFTRITGYREDEIIGRNIHILNVGDVNSEIYQTLRAEIRNRGHWSGEIVNQRKNGESFPAHLSVTAVRNSQQTICHYVSIFYDTSAEKAAERALIETSKLKSEFISTAAHELRTPLSAIMGYTEFVRYPENFGGFSRDQIDDFLDEIYDRGEALNQLIDDLLDISRIESGHPINLNLEEACIVGLLVKSIEFFKGFDTRHIFILDTPEPSPQTLYLIDRYRINQVLENLLGNAVKYSSAGREIRVRCTIESEHCIISIEDQGIGMTPEQVARIFDKFYRADSSNTAVSGLGLGMSIARKIVENHGGTIWVESVKDVGTTVFFSLPHMRAEESA